MTRNCVFVVNRSIIEKSRRAVVCKFSNVEKNIQKIHPSQTAKFITFCKNLVLSSENVLVITLQLFWYSTEREAEEKHCGDAYIYTSQSQTSWSLIKFYLETEKQPTMPCFSTYNLYDIVNHSSAHAGKSFADITDIALKRYRACKNGVIDEAHRLLYTVLRHNDCKRCLSGFLWWEWKWINTQTFDKAMDLGLQNDSAYFWPSVLTFRVF